MRAFIALELPEQFVEEIDQLAYDLRSCVKGRFMPRSNYHLTLAFLGDIDERDAASAMAAIDTAVENLPVPLTGTGLGTFGRANDATLWLGLDPAPELLALAECVREELTARGVDFDTKAFKPHITLARRANIAPNRMPLLSFPRATQGARITLFKSTLTSEGAIYKPLYSLDCE